MIGQYALAEVEAFREKRRGELGLIMNQLNGTARGGILAAAAGEFGRLTDVIGVGERVDDLLARSYRVRSLAP